jgi:hypothetical protein
MAAHLCPRTLSDATGTLRRTPGLHTFLVKSMDSRYAAAAYDEE